MGPIQPAIPGTGSFPGVKRSGRGVDHPPAISAEVKERVELYLYSRSGPSWSILGWNLRLALRTRLVAVWSSESVRDTWWKISTNSPTVQSRLLSPCKRSYSGSLHVPYRCVLYWLGEWQQTLISQVIIQNSGCVIHPKSTETNYNMIKKWS